MPTKTNATADLKQCKQILVELLTGKYKEYTRPFINAENLRIDCSKASGAPAIGLQTVSNNFKVGKYLNGCEFVDDIRSVLAYFVQIPSPLPLAQMANKLQAIFEERVATVSKRSSENFLNISSQSCNSNDRFSTKGTSSTILRSCISIMEELLSPRHSKYGQYIYHINNSPIDLFSIKRKLNKRQYDTVEEFASDMRAMFSNCYRLFANNRNSIEMAQQLQNVFTNNVLHSTTDSLIEALESFDRILNKLKSKSDKLKSALVKEKKKHKQQTNDQMNNNENENVFFNLSSAYCSCGRTQNPFAVEPEIRYEIIKNTVDHLNENFMQTSCSNMLRIKLRKVNTKTVNENESVFKSSKKMPILDHFNR